MITETNLNDTALLPADLHKADIWQVTIKTVKAYALQKLKK